MKLFINISFKNISRILKPYCILVILFVISGLIFKTFETFSFCKAQDSVSFLTILQSYFNITTVFCLSALILLPVYLLLRLFGNNIAQIFISILFALLISLEIGLYIYYRKAGVLMGIELIIRPFSEVMTTIRNSSNIFHDIISILGLVALFMAIPFLLKRVKILYSFLSFAVLLSMMCVFSAGILFYQKDKNQTINNYLESKSFYFFSSIKDYLIEEAEIEYFVVDEAGYRVEKNETLLKEYISLFNNTNDADFEYPMERPVSYFPDVLSPFLKKSDT